MIHILAKHSANLNLALKEQGVSPAYVAAQHGYIEVIKALALYKADLNQVTSKGATAACIAAQKGHLDIIKVLNESIINLNYLSSKQ